MTDEKKEVKEGSIPENKLEELEKKIYAYSSLRTKQEEVVDDEFALPDEGIEIDITQGIVFTESGTNELRIPSVEEMRKDFSELAELVIEKHEAGAIPSSLWAPVRDLSEKYLASEAAPADVDVRWNVFAPVYLAFAKYEDYLIQPGIEIIGGSTKDWIMSVDKVMGENLPRLTSKE